jgi:Beta-ketoacyl synthase, N-terminal domain
VIAAIADASAPIVSGFIESTFSPVVYEAVRQCLAEAPGEGAADGARTAIVLASTMGDSGTLDLGSRLLIAGEVSNPLLFMQSTANAILGRMSIDFAITGPLIALSPLGDLAADLLATADVLLADGEVDRVVLVGVELAGSARTTAAHRELGTRAPTADLAVAIVLDRGDVIPTEPDPTAPVPGAPAAPSSSSTTYGSLRGLVEAAARIRGATSC